ncbi:adenosine deaminase [Chitinimonas taiwanensis]|uniref:Adenosine deaminase n=1 Tax=Chitinimonas taiwanensis DSM 18899 TaxID=1121279 RepID=A0A1K2H681_9NEIS|nr:adenosine deaminase [Chitinimonas taiwanensis]SFZ70981.1 hypothetical protein SAMN02745887_00368 [Chitinimonas taiwanensis DSM 18899]
MKKIILAAAAGAVVLLSGCASILNEETQKINVSTSNGAEAKLSVDGKTFTAPGVVEVKRQKTDKVLVSETPNCAKETAMASKVDSKFFINILSGGAFGSTTDYATEKMWAYQDSIVVACK